MGAQPEVFGEAARDRIATLSERETAMRMWLAAVATALLLALTTSASAQVKIGLSAPLTGPDAAFGQGMRLGAEQAVAELNRSGGVNGQRLQLTVLDDAGEAKQAQAVAAKFAASGVRFVIGPLSSGTVAAALPAYEEAGILILVPNASWPALTARGAWNVFRLGGNDAQQGVLAGTWLAATYRAKPVAVVHDRSSFGKMLAEEAARALKANGGREALFESLARGERDFSALARKIKAARAEAVYFGGLATEAALLLRALREAGIDAPLVASDGILDKDFAQLAGPGAEGTVMTRAPDPRRLPEPRATAGKAVRTPEAESLASETYAAIELLKQVIEAAKGPDPRRIADLLHGGQAFRTQIGEIAFDPKGDRKGSPYAIEVWRKSTDGRIDYAQEPDR